MGCFKRDILSVLRLMTGRSINIHLNDDCDSPKYFIKSIFIVTHPDVSLVSTFHSILSHSSLKILFWTVLESLSTYLYFEPGITNDKVSKTV